jgi:hypothetical protein
MRGSGRVSHRSYWGEFEINTLANPTRPLAHIWPQGGIWGTDVFLHGKYNPGTYLLIGFVKLAAISITVLSGEFDICGVQAFASGVTRPIFKINIQN